MKSSGTSMRSAASTQYGRSDSGRRVSLNGWTGGSSRRMSFGSGQGSSTPCFDPAISGENASRACRGFSGESFSRCCLCVKVLVDNSHLNWEGASRLAVLVPPSKLGGQLLGLTGFTWRSAGFARCNSPRPGAGSVRVLPASRKDIPCQPVGLVVHSLRCAW